MPSSTEAEGYCRTLLPHYRPKHYDATAPTRRTPVEDAMRLGLSPARRWRVIAAPVLTVAALTGTASAAAYLAGAAHARRVAPPAAGGAHANQADAQPGQATPGEFTTTANPVTLDAPVRVPPSRPVVVTI